MSCDVVAKKQLAEEIRNAACLAAARLLTPERNLPVVLVRIEVVSFMIEDLAEWIIDGKHRPYRQA